MSIVVVSGLASGVGKTTAAAAIVRVLQDRGRDVIPVKVARLQNQRVQPDIGTIEKLTGIKGMDFSQSVNPIAEVRALVAAGKTVVIEGSGGLGVPLLGDRTIAHIAAELDAPLVVVSGMDAGAVKLAVDAVHFAHGCGARVEGLIGGKLPVGADLRTRLILMEVSNATGVPFIGSLRDNIGNLGAAAFADATQTIFLPDNW